MSEMVERVARAIYEARWGGGDWDTLCEQRKAKFEISKWMPMARAAIAAMREPTEAMQRAWKGPERWDDDASEVWQEMIDAALAKESQPA